MKEVLKVENISKQYNIGVIGTGTLSHDINRWWAKIRGKEDPYLKITESNDRAVEGNSNLVWALQDISFSVNQGDILGVIGKNGAGKSTLLKLLSNISSPTSGIIKAKGRIAALLEVGTGFHPELTGRENVFLNGAILGMTKSEIKSKLDEIVDFSGVARYIDTPVKRYSSGMLVRLGFSVAAHLEPEILVVDEVLAVGDAEFQKKAIGKMQKVSKSGRTVLFVSHNMAAISALCNRAILLQNGRFKMEGDPDEVIAHYVKSTNSLSESSINLEDRVNERFGSKEYAKWKSIELTNGQNEPTNVFRMGEEFKVKLGLEVFKTSKNFEIGLAIANMQEVVLHQVLSNWEGLSSIDEQGLHQIEVNLPSVGLFPGLYQIAIWIAIQGAFYDDAIHEVLQFEVEEGKLNEHPTYFARFSKNTQVYTPSKWKIVKVD